MLSNERKQTAVDVCVKKREQWQRAMTNLDDGRLICLFDYEVLAS